MTSEVVLIVIDAEVMDSSRTWWVDTKATTQTSPHSPVILKFLKNTTTRFGLLPLNKKKHPLSGVNWPIPISGLTPFCQRTPVQPHLHQEPSQRTRSSRRRLHGFPQRTRTYRDV